MDGIIRICIKFVISSFVSGVYPVSQLWFIISKQYWNMPVIIITIAQLFWSSEFEGSRRAIAPNIVLPVTIITEETHRKTSLN